MSVTAVLVLGSLMCALVFFLLMNFYRSKCGRTAHELDAVVDTNHALMEQLAKAKGELEIEARHARELGEEIARIKRLSVDDVMRGLSE